MAATKSTKRPRTSEDAYQRCQQQALWKFTAEFEAWTVRAAADVETTPLHPSAGQTLGDLAQGRWLAVTDDVRDAAIQRQVDLVYELARLCLRFITSDLCASGLYHRRQGASLEAVIELVQRRAATVIAEAHARKWRAGLGVITSEWDRLYADADWRQDVWSVVVEDAMADYIAICLSPLLADPEIIRFTTSRDTGPHAKVHRHRVQQFIQKLLDEQGVRITLGDIGCGLCGYSDKSGADTIRRYQRDSPRIGAAEEMTILRVLNLDSAEAWRRIQRYRLRKSTPTVH